MAERYAAEEPSIQFATMHPGTNIHIDGQMDRWIDGQRDRWIDGQMDRWIDGQMDKWINRQNG